MEGDYLDNRLFASPIQPMMAMATCRTYCPLPREIHENLPNLETKQIPLALSCTYYTLPFIVGE